MSGLVVIVKQGWLRGAVVKNPEGRSYISFKGIPYAAPPLGNLRLADPQPPLQWTGVRDAINDGAQCPQIDFVSSEINGDEDCLYLNVSTPSLKGSRPVMVWIHGGAFANGAGTSKMYAPDRLMKKDIVVVSINYRLNIFGFLQLDHEVAPGNMGLKDQVAALQWVKENIAQFGGNPNNVTIFGESAGSASVHYLLLSPLAKGLFHKAILQSGVALNPWASVPEPDYLRKYLTALGIETTDPHEIIEYLRTIPARRLVEAQQAIQSTEDAIRFLYTFRPNVDDKSQRPFMPKSLQEMAVEGFDVPVMIGYNEFEGMVITADPTGLTDEKLSLIDQMIEKLIQPLAGKDSSKIPAVAKEIRNFYFEGKQITKEVIKQLIECYGDIFFVSGIQRVVDIQRNKKTPTYFYKFIYDSPNSFGKLILNYKMPGTGHGDDIPYIFRSVFGSDFVFEPKSSDRIVSDRFIRMWTDFAKTGNPTPKIDDLITVKWEPITWTTKNCLLIGNQLANVQNPDNDKWELYKRISDIASSQ